MMCRLWISWLILGNVCLEKVCISGCVFFRVVLSVFMLWLVDVIVLCRLVINGFVCLLMVCVRLLIFFVVVFVCLMVIWVLVSVVVILGLWLVRLFDN